MNDHDRKNDRDFDAPGMMKPVPPRQDETDDAEAGAGTPSPNQTDPEDSDPDDSLTIRPVADDDVMDEEDRMQDAIDASAGSNSGSGAQAGTSAAFYEPASGLSGAALSDDPDAITQGAVRTAIGDDEPVNGEDLLADINVDEQNIDVEQQVVEIDATMPVDVQMRRDEID
jgi:hypothetical protein